MTGRVHYPRPSVEFFIDSSTASRSISPTSAAYVKLAENFAERWAELRLVESVNQRIENNGRLGKKSRDGCRQGRLPLHLAVTVEWAELTDESDNDVRRPGCQTEQGQRQNDQRRPQLRLTPVL